MRRRIVEHHSTTSVKLLWAIQEFEGRTENVLAMKSGKAFMTRAEGITLLGMLLIVASLFFTWARVTPRDQAFLTAAALYRSPQVVLERNGFGHAQLWQVLTL